MRQAFRRVLWVIPSMVVISALTFWVLARSAPPAAGEPLPFFVNPAPRDVRDRALSAMRRIAQGEAPDGPAGRELVRLGGAALPHVLPRLDTLAPAARIQLARSLEPLARRMRVPNVDELADPGRAVTFWSEFWQARAVDFRPAVVKRLVKRLGQRTSPTRREDIAALDTFALEELMAAMATVATAADVERVRRIADLGSDLTGLPWRVPDGGGLDEARDASGRWLRWWSRNRSSYVTFDGPRRLSAMLTETAYGHWATDAVQSRLGTAASGRPVLDEFLARAPITLWLVLAGLTVGPIAGALAGMIAAARARGSVDAVTTLLALVAVSVPTATLAVWLGGPATALSMTLAALTMSALSFGLSCLYQRRQTLAALGRGHAVTLIAQGASPLRVARRQFRLGLVSVVSLLGADVPLLLTSAFVLERGFDLPGLGPATLVALRTGDDAWLMALALISVVLTALVQIASDALLAVVDPRLAPALGHRTATE